jgi:hypothetical protein
VQSQLVGHVGNLVSGVNCFSLDLEGAFLVVVELYSWPGVSCLFEFPLEDFHDAMSVGVIMDRAAFPRRPDKDELYQSVTRCDSSVCRPIDSKVGACHNLRR